MPENINTLSEYLVPVVQSIGTNDYVRGMARVTKQGCNIGLKDLEALGFLKCK